MFQRTCCRHGARHVTQDFVIQPPPPALPPHLGDGLQGQAQLSGQLLSWTICAFLLVARLAKLLVAIACCDRPSNR